jgi:hypothetical protein
MSRVPGKQEMRHSFPQPFRAGGGSVITVAVGTVLRGEASPPSADT